MINPPEHLIPILSLVNMFKKDDEYKCEDGFDSSEIESFGPRSLVVVVTTLVDLAKHQSEAYLHHYFDLKNQEDGSLRFDEITTELLQALKIFEDCPAKKLGKENLEGPDLVFWVIYLVGP